MNHEREWEAIVGTTIRGMLACLGPPPRTEVVDTYVRLLRGQHPRNVVAGCDRLLATWEGGWPPAPSVVIRAVEKASLQHARELLLASTRGGAEPTGDPCELCLGQGVVCVWSPDTMRQAVAIVSENAPWDSLQPVQATVPCTCPRGDAWAINVAADGTLVALGRFRDPCIRVGHSLQQALQALRQWAQRYVDHQNRQDAAGSDPNEVAP